MRLPMQVQAWQAWQAGFDLSNELTNIKTFPLYTNFDNKHAPGVVHHPRYLLSQAMVL